MSAHSSRRGDRSGRPGLESLEARIVLAAPYDLAVVGMTYDATDGYVPYAAELVWAADRSLTGDTWVTGASGPVGPTDTNFSDLVNGPAGAAIPFYHTPSFPDATLGSRFLTENGYPLGWIGGTSGADATAEADVAAVIERAANGAVTDLIGNWSFQITHISSEGVFTRHGLVSFNSTGGFFSIATGATGDPIWVGEGFEFDGAPDHGRFDIGMGSGDTAVLYLSADKSVLLIADMDERDGDSWMGIGLHQGIELTDAQVVGSYRVGVLYEGQDLVPDANMSDIDDGAAATAWRIDLDADGTFEMFGLGDADGQDFSEVAATGPWTNDDGVITLQDTQTGIRIRIKLSENGKSGILQEFQQLTPALTERPMAIVTKVATDPQAGQDTVLWAGILDADGRPVVFDLRRGTDSWSVVDFDRYARPDLVHWMDTELGASPADIEAFAASDGGLMAAVSTNEGLFAMARDATGFWRLRNLTTTINAAANIVGTITVFEDKRGVSYVAGLTAAGDMVTYEFDPDAATGTDAWSYTNLSTEHLVPQGETTPVFVGPLMSYVTAWNGLNIAGLAADGSIQAVWTGNGGQVWHASNLSTITGAPPMASGLTAYLTSWGGINIVGLDDGGQVLASWWVPGFGGVWKISNLTTVAGGPALTGDSLTSFFAPWGALNIAGLDENGDMQAYWWTPETDVWQVANLTASIPDGQPRPASQLMGQANLTHGGELNIMGTDATTGELLRLFFRVDDGAWAVQNVSDDAAWV